MNIASIITRPDNPVLGDTLLAYLASELPRAGLVKWLAPGTAAEIPFVGRGAALALAWERATEVIGDLPVDLNIISGINRRKRLLVADMDSTIIQQECVDELADLVGKRAEVAAITERAMRGEIEFAGALRERVALLRGIRENQVEALLRDRITATPGAATLVQTMRSHGAYTALVSGGFTLMTGAVAARLGFDEHRGNVLGLAGGKLSGTLEEPVAGADAKRQAIVELRERLGLEADDTVAVGDGANDIDMMRQAGLSVSFNGKPAVAAAATARIRHGDLTALLYLQGYSRDEFATG
jgi:phosphoserine phosphatase